MSPAFRARTATRLAAVAAYTGITRRVWLTNALDGYLVRIEPHDDPRATVTVRAASESFGAGFDGVWVNGERSYDTHVFIDGVTAYHAPAFHLAGRSFDAHERAGGGHAP